MTSNLTHHPDCEYWHDGSPCTCGLTAEAQPGMRPWSQAAFDEWARAVNAYKATIDEKEPTP